MIKYPLGRLPHQCRSHSGPINAGAWCLRCRVSCTAGTWGADVIDHGRPLVPDAGEVLQHPRQVLKIPTQLNCIMKLSMRTNISSSSNCVHCTWHPARPDPDQQASCSRPYRNAGCPDLTPTSVVWVAVPQPSVARPKPDKRRVVGHTATWCAPTQSSQASCEWRTANRYTDPNPTRVVWSAIPQPGVPRPKPHKRRVRDAPQPATQTLS
jgi:hypothetical protein